MRIVVICNPVSGRGKALRHARLFEDAASSRGHAVTVIPTRSADHLQTIESQFPDRVDTIVCVGGDGTINALVNGLTDPSAIPLVQLATGTANLLARELNLPLDPRKLVDVVEDQHIRQFDLMIIDGVHRAIMIISVGFDAMVIEAIHRNRKGALGFRGYVGPIVRTALQYEPPALRMMFDGNEEEVFDTQFVAVGNIKHYAAFLSLTDLADCESGHLDICAIDDASSFNLIKHLPAARRRTLSSTRSVMYKIAQKIRIECDSPVPVEVDGEYYGSTPIDITILPGAVPILGVPS